MIGPIVAAIAPHLAHASPANPWPCASPEACASQEFYQIPGANPMYVPRGSVKGLSYVMKAKAAHDKRFPLLYTVPCLLLTFLHPPFTPLTIPASRRRAA